MFPSPESPSDRGEAQTLYRRLLDGDLTAPVDLAATYLDRLVAWLNEHNPRIDPDWCRDAAEDALVTLLRNPASYRPDLQDLEVFLRMSAQRDLQNILRREGRHRRGCISLQRVELSPEAGKYLGRDDDPALPLLLEEQERHLFDSIPPSVREGLTEREARVLALMLRKERRHGAFAEAYGVTQLPPAEQKKEVKRVKDRLKARLKRAGKGDEQEP